MMSTKNIVIHNIVTPYRIHPQKWAIDLLFKNNNPISCGRHKCMVPN